MPSKAKRAQINRRDRRKAKASNWAREGRSNPKKVGHGGSGQITTGRSVSGRSVSENSVEHKKFDKSKKFDQTTLRFNYAIVANSSDEEIATENCATNLGEQLQKVLDGSQ